MAAALNVLYALAAWKQLVVVVAGVLFLLLAVGSIEQWSQKALGLEEKADPPDSRLVFGGVASAFSVKAPTAQYQHGRRDSGRTSRSAADNPPRNIAG